MSPARDDRGTAGGARERNDAVLTERFPAVAAWLEGADASAEARSLGPIVEPATPRPTLSVAGLQLASGYDPGVEAAAQAELVPTDAREAWCYGIGTGELPRALLARNALRELTVALCHPVVARAVFHRFDCTDWLADPRVTLAPAKDTGDLKTPFAAGPADLRLAEDGAVRVRDQAFLELATPHLRRHVAARAGDLLARYAENAELVRSDGDVAMLFGTKVGGRAWIAGAGPTLGAQVTRLASRDEAEPLIAADAALAPLMANGVLPDVVLTMDAHAEHQLPMFDVDLDALSETPLVYSPQVHRDVLLRWRGPRYAFFEPARRSEVVRLGVVRGELWSSGSVIHPAVDLAVRMGASEVRFAGMDFGHVGGRTHVSGSHHERDHIGGDVRAGAFVLNGRGERIPSAPNLVGYLRDLERYVAARSDVRFLNLSRDGARIAGVDVEGEA